MLKKLIVKDFESHEDSEYEFSEGLNLFRGESDTGKSSIMRAISVVAFNIWDEGMLRVGAKNAFIRLETDKGFVETVRGSGKNDWVVGILKDGEIVKEEFTKIGKTVPEIATKVIGMPKIELGEVVDLPNVMCQGDKHYMLSEVNGKKCTASMVAQMVDEVVGLGGVEELIKEIGLDGSRAKRKANDNSERIKELQEKIHSEETIEKKKKKLDDCESRLKAIEDKTAKKEVMQKILDKYNTLTDKKESIKNKLKKIDIDVLIEKQKTLTAKTDKCKKLMDIKEKIDKKQEALESIRNKKKNIPDIESVKNRYDKLKRDSDEYLKLEEVKSGYDKKETTLSSIRSKLKIAKQEYEDAEKKKEDFIKENPNCPLCGKILEGDTLL